MKFYTGFEYLLIDAANAFGMDKELFETRIHWGMENLRDLEDLMGQAESPFLFIKAVMAIRDAQKGIPTGHMMGLDACASGPQLMGALLGCETTLRSTGLIDPDVRADLYTGIKGAMNQIMEQPNYDASRNSIKEATVPFCYGSSAKPKEIFGEGTPEYNAYFGSVGKVAPAVLECMSTLLSAWQPYAKVHQWTLPDGSVSRVKVMTDMTDSQGNYPKVEVDELNHATFTHKMQVNEGTKTGLSIAANVIHSIDAYVVNEMKRRCAGLPMISTIHNPAKSTTPVHKPFPLVTVHDEFKASPNNMNLVRSHYIGILAEIADSEILSDILSEIYGRKGTVPKYAQGMGDLIRKSNYGLS